ncbi:MAG: hypothetical protein IKR30_01435 [Bacteroidales bacterium]|nr:hypothetical protein [Bacteroidales bacterium]
MKRFLLVLSIVLLAGSTTVAQDIITKRGGIELQAKILEVTNSEIKYKRFSNLDGPTFTLPKSDVLVVRYENGETEVFNSFMNIAGANTDQQVYPGMRYNEYKDLYDTHFYTRTSSDPYSPFWIGFAEFFIPGLGEAITGEWGRAAGFFFGNLGLNALSWTQRSTVESNGSTYYEYSPFYWAIKVAQLGINIWGICDAVHVAKVKNMYNQDLLLQRASIDIDVAPFITYTPTYYNGLQPCAGLALKVNF